MSCLAVYRFALWVSGYSANDHIMSLLVLLGKLARTILGLFIGYGLY